MALKLSDLLSSRPPRLHRNLQRNDAATLSFGRRRDKPGVGYTCSLQAMSCVSRVMPDLHHAATRAAPYAAAFPTAGGTEGVRGATRFFALTFTCHFRRWRTPHWGDVARECPPAALRRFRRAKAATGKHDTRMPRRSARVGQCPFDARKRPLVPIGCLELPSMWGSFSIPRNFSHLKPDASHPRLTGDCSSGTQRSHQREE